MAHLTSAVSPRYAPDISGVTSTVMPIAGAVGEAAFSTAYLGLAPNPGTGSATHAFAVITAGFAAIAAFAQRTT